MYPQLTLGADLSIGELASHLRPHMLEMSYCSHLDPIC